MTTKNKVVFVIVEGPSDDMALGTLFTRIYKEMLKMQVQVEILHGDITSDFNVDSHNIVATIGNIVRNRIKEMRLKKSDIFEVIQVVDTDGVFIPDNLIIEDQSCKEFKYTRDNIFFYNRDKVIERNKRKRENLNRIINMKNICKDIPYHIYYMSSCLDFALYNKLNSTDEEKEEDAFEFVEKYEKNLDEFIDYLCKSDFSKCESYLESWNFIKEGKHSLERYTNLGLCFKSIES